MPALPTLTAFAASPPPWSLASLDTNFTNISTLLKSANNYSLYLADAGAANAYAVSFAAGVTWTLAAGAEVLVNPANANTTASTLAVNSGTAKNLFMNGAALVGGEIKAGVPFIAVYDGTQFNIVASSRAPTRQTFTSGTGATYTTPAGCKAILVCEKAGGGGGGGGGAAGTGVAGTGGTTTFNSITVIGGGPGSSNGITPGLGGTGGSGTAVRWPGAPGIGSTSFILSATNAQGQGGNGGGVGAGRGGGGATAGSTGAANTGAGAGGGGVASQVFASFATDDPGSGGGEGEYAEFFIYAPAATYTYSVGAGGTAGTGVNAGGVGSAGRIIVWEFY